MGEYLDGSITFVSIPDDQLDRVREIMEEDGNAWFGDETYDEAETFLPGTTYIGRQLRNGYFDCGTGPMEELHAVPGLVFEGFQEGNWEFEPVVYYWHYEHGSWWSYANPEGSVMVGSYRIEQAIKDGEEAGDNFAGLVLRLRKIIGPPWKIEAE